MDDHTGEKNNGSRRRAESVLEQRYKELYGDASSHPEGTAETPAPREAEAPAPAEPDAPEDAARAAWDEEEAFPLPAIDKPVREKRAKEKAMPEKTPREKPASDAKSRKAPRSPAPEPKDKRGGSSRRVDTLERSTARRAYTQPPAKPMKTWPWALAAGLIVLALAGLLLYSLLGPLPGSQPAPTATPGPTFPSANVLNQPTDSLPTDAPTPAPTDTPTPLPTVDATATPDTKTVLRPGTSGESVKVMQRRLMELGYLAGDTADGDYGKATQEAVLRFQQAHNLTADGYAGEQTLTLLYGDAAKPAAAAAAAEE